MDGMNWYTPKVTNKLTGVALLTGIAAAVFWFGSAPIPIPGISPQFDADYSPLTNALRRQSNLSGIAAVLTGLSVVFQALAQRYSKEVR